MSRKQNTRIRKPGASLGRTWRYILPESHLLSFEDYQELKNELEHDEAKNLKVYPGAPERVSGLKERITRAEGPSASPDFAAPGDLLAWLEAGNAHGPLVVEAELPPLVESQTQEPTDYRKEIERVRAIPNDTAGILMYDRAWPSVKKLAAIEKNLLSTNMPVELETERKELHKILLERYPEYAEKLGLPKPPLPDLLEQSPAATVGLDEHEKKVLEVIKRGQKGRQYCRELDNARINPRRTGSWKECPGTYLGAYDEGGHWRQRVQDEKSKIRRKAKQLAKHSQASKNSSPKKPA